MFQDDFKLGKFEWAGFLLYAVPIFIYRLPDFGIDLPFSPSFNKATNIGVDVVTFTLMAHLVYVALKGRNDDLVESRRKFRLSFVLVLVGASLTTVIAENLFVQTHYTEVSILRGAVALPVVIWALLALTRLHPEKFLFQSLTQAEPKPATLDLRDTALNTRLIALMENDETYTEMGLTIRNLAERLKTPEHRLRQMINKGLGHRNFSAFLNTFRIKAAKAALSDPENARLPVLTIAMDVGFASLSPFNRAFKAAEGLTPTEYRQATLERADQN
jgi:AraC-like DNA-binding protein